MPSFAPSGARIQHNSQRVTAGSEALPVAAIIPTWNSAKDICGCLDALFWDPPQEVVVVDNGSVDDTLSLVRRGFPEVKTIAFGSNRGFSVACNVGIKATGAPYVLLLNDDALLGPGYLRRLVTRLEAESSLASAVGKLLLPQGDGPRRIDSAGIALCRYALRPLDRGHGEVDVGQFDQEVNIFGPSAAAALYRRRALSAVGPDVFDEDLFAYYEDVDLAWRLQRKGWRHRYVAEAVAVHQRRGPGSKPAHIARRAFTNRYLIWLKNESVARFVAYAPLALVWEVVRLLRRLGRGEFYVLVACWRAAKLAPRFMAKRGGCA